MYGAASELQAFLGDHPEISHCDAFVVDLCGNAIGKRLPRAHMEKLYSSGTPICAAMQLVDVLGNTADPMGHGFSDGDPDANARPLPGMIATVPWTGGSNAQVLCELTRATTGEPFWYDPRRVLQGVVERFESLALKPVVALELEFYLIDLERDESGGPQPARSPLCGATEAQGKVLSIAKLDEFAPLLEAMQAACRAQGIPVSTMISEYGAGQFEINLEHQSDPLRAADHAALLRRAIQGVARSQGYDATFLAKPFADQSGSGLHIHLSLQNAAGENAFNPERAHGEALLGQAVAGLQATMHEAMALFAPNINVYRRFKPDEFTPVTRDWGENNRSVAFRLPVGEGESRRLEHRVAGAEANPYLVTAAVLAGVHHGLTENLEPGEKHGGNAGAEVDASLPLTMWDALTALKQRDDPPRLHRQGLRADLRRGEAGRARGLHGRNLSARVRVVSMSRDRAGLAHLERAFADRCAVTEDLIVGGGVYGCALAWELVTRGAPCRLLEAKTIGAGASSGPGRRGVRANGRDPREIPLMRQARQIWPSLHETLGSEPLFERTGHLLLIERPEDLAEAEARASLQNLMGIESQLLSAEQTREREPHVSELVRAAIYCPDDGVADHTATTQAYVAAARAGSATIDEAIAASRLIVEGDRVVAVETDDGGSIALKGGSSS